MKLAELLLEEAVFPRVEARDKKQSLKHMSALAASVCGVSEKEIYTTLMEREHQATTCMGSGVCMPHGRFDVLDKPYAFFARFDRPVEFNGEDGKPVDLMFLLLSPENENTEHLKSLALLSKLLRNKELCGQLRNTEDAADIYELLDGASKDEHS